MKWFDRHGVRFLVAGAANTLVGYALYLLFNLAFDYRVAYTLSFAIGIVISFVLNSLYVFRQPLRWKRLIVYPAVYLLQYVVGLGCVWLFVDVMHQSELLAPFLAVAVSLPLTFVATRFVLKGKPHVTADH